MKTKMSTRKEDEIGGFGGSGTVSVNVLLAEQLLPTVEIQRHVSRALCLFWTSSCCCEHV